MLSSGWPLREAQADLTVAREVAGGGEDEVAEAGQSHEGFEVAAELDAETGHFGQPTGDERGAGVVAELQAVADAGGNGHDVFECAADFDADDIVVCVDAQAMTGQGFGQVLCQRGLAGGQGECGRVALRDFLGEAGPRQHAGLCVLRADSSAMS